jgi:stage II sporulation protein D
MRINAGYSGFAWRRLRPLGIALLTLLMMAAAFAFAQPAPPAQDGSVRLRVLSLHTLSALTVETADPAGSGRANTAGALRMFNEAGALAYTAEYIRVTAQGNRLFVDGDEVASLRIEPAVGSSWTPPLAARQRRTCSTQFAPVKISGARTSRVFAGHLLQVYAHEGKLIVVAVLPLEEYIPGVLTAEAGPYAALPRAQAEQYLAAQAVACRSYAAYYLQSGKRRHVYENIDYDFCDSTHCQAWRDAESPAPDERGRENPAAQKQEDPYPEIIRSAVQRTRGKVLALGGEYAPGLYSSAAAQVTALPSEVWGGRELDRFFQPVTNRMKGAADFLHKRSPYAQWTWREEKEAFRIFLRDAFRFDWDGALPEVTYSPEGVVRHIAFGVRRTAAAEKYSRIIDKDTQAAKCAERENIDELACLVNRVVLPGSIFRDEFCRARHWGSIASLSFKVRFTGAAIVFTGSGLGHGIGLCQYGAMELARASWTWENILRFYYPKLTCVPYSS